MLNKIKILLGIADNSKDELLRILLDQTEEEVVNYTHNDELDKLQNVIINIAIWKYNRLGSEGLNAENYSGVSFSYLNEYPDAILKQLQAYRRIRTLDKQRA